jgi:hypothetical protein
MMNRVLEGAWTEIYDGGSQKAELHSFKLVAQTMLDIQERATNWGRGAADAHVAFEDHPRNFGCIDPRGPRFSAGFKSIILFPDRFGRPLCAPRMQEASHWSIIFPICAALLPCYYALSGDVQIIVFMCLSCIKFVSWRRKLEIELTH